MSDDIGRQLRRFATRAPGDRANLTPPTSESVSDLLINNPRYGKKLVAFNVLYFFVPPLIILAILALGSLAKVWQQ